jgi:RimJ/RimL family protein N-acetyltransferase
MYALLECKGPTMSGHPEARFEAYARAFASTGPYVHRDYRRSYARLYESFSCLTHAAEERFRTLYTERPQDLIGRLVRLESLEVDRHVKDLFDGTSGLAYQNCRQFDPKEVWGFLEYGPFKTTEEMASSPVFQRKLNEARFAILDHVSDRLFGVIMLFDDNPKHLTISMEPPICKPSSEETLELTEACFLVIDRLFALGYRRIQMSVDSQDIMHKRLAARLGFTKEGELLKHMVVKDSNRDSIVYSMLNSDWSKGCRSYLFEKLHGKKMQNYDKSNNQKEGDMDDQKSKLKERKLHEEALAREAMKV